MLLSTFIARAHRIAFCCYELYFIFSNKTFNSLFWPNKQINLWTNEHQVTSCKLACAGSPESLVLSEPEMMSSFRLPGLPNAMQGAVEGLFGFPFVPRQLETLLIHCISNSCKQRKNVMGISRLGQITTLLFISHLLIHRKEGERRSLDGQLSMCRSWMLSPFQMYSE